jgi:hypothetical protein
MKHSIWGLLLATSYLSGADLVWDDEGKINGIDSDRWNIKENWSSDMLPTGSDKVSLLDKGPVELLNASATVNIIISKIPFKLGETLTINSEGTFEDSLITTTEGRIRANGPVVFKGSNFLAHLTLEGNGTFTNDGSATFGTRGIDVDTSFKNRGEFSLVSGLTNLGVFDNTGTFDFGSRGSINSSTVFINKGTMKKEVAAEISQVLAGFVQEGGQVFVKEGAELTFGSAVQEWQSGEIVVDGKLILTKTVGGEASLSFDGLSEIKGDGNVIQVQEFELNKDLIVNMPNAPGYTIGDLVFGRFGSPEFAILTNSGYIKLDGVKEFVLGNSTDTDSLFVNSMGATVVQGTASNPLLNKAALRQ